MRRDLRDLTNRGHSSKQESGQPRTLLALWTYPPFESAILKFVALSIFRLLDVTDLPCTKLELEQHY